MILRLLLAFLLVFSVACGRTEMIKEEKCLKIVGKEFYDERFPIPETVRFLVLEDGRRASPDPMRDGRDGYVGFGYYCETTYPEER